LNRDLLPRALAAAVALALVSSPAAAAPKSDRAAILGVIGKMEAAWNRGDFRGYMAGFKRPDVVFVSGGKYQQGWQGTLDHYIRDYGGSAERRGRLHFYEMKVDSLAPDAAMLIGRYRLERPGRVTHGINTRLFRKIGGRWLIAMNHVSAYDVPAPVPTAPAAR
jgi:ketosteroid isomerase-like protein